MTNVTPMLIASDVHSPDRNRVHTSTSGRAITLSSNTTLASTHRPRRGSTRIHRDEPQPASSGTISAATMTASSRNT
jgi:hypothetical protein